MSDGARSIGGSGGGHVGRWTDLDLERRVCAGIVIAAALLFFVFLLIAPAPNPTYDDAKYVGIGRNILAGDGPYTVFGVLFLKHSPVWPVVVAAPEALLGIAPIAVGHVVNAACAALLIGLVGAVGWRIRPAAGALGAIVVAGLPYSFDLARTAGIDLPSIALTFVYLLVGWLAVDRGSLRLGALAGIVFALAFLIKETIIPFAPVPFITGVLWGRSWASISRVAAAALGLGALGAGWWFAIYAGYTGQIYRADFLDSWVLLPVLLAVVVLVPAGLAADRIARGLATRGWPATVTARLPTRIRDHGRTTAAWILTGGWLVLMYVLFSKTPKLLGASLLDPAQVRYFLEHSLLSIRVATVFSIGSVLLLGWRPTGAAGRALAALAIAGICGIPLVLLVLGVGETPRHYLAVTALWVLLGSVGWVTTFARAIAGERRAAVGLAAVGIVTAAAGLVVVRGRIAGLLFVLGLGGAILAGVIVLGVGWWLWRRGQLARLGLVTALAVACVGTLAAVGVRAMRPASATGVLEQRASSDTDAWLRTHVTAGQTVALGPYLSMEMALDLPGGVRAVQVRHYLATADPAAPFGLHSEFGNDLDWVAVDSAPGKANQFNVYDQRLVIDGLKASGASYYVYPVGTGTSQEILNVLTPANGFDEAATFTYTAGDRTLVTHVYRVDPARLAIDPSKMYISADALDRLTTILEHDPTHGRVAAAGLLARIVPAADGSLDPMLDRLRKLAGT